MSCGTPDRQLRTCNTSSLVSTVGSRLGLWARHASTRRAKSIARTSRYRNNRADRAPILGGGGDVHLAWVAFAMKQDEAPDPLGIAFLRVRRVVFAPDGFLHLFEQFLGTRFHGDSL
jgi:hypothetical protein